MVRSKWEQIGDAAFAEPLKAVAITAAIFFVINRGSYALISATGLIKVSAHLSPVTAFPFSRAPPTILPSSFLYLLFLPPSRWCLNHNLKTIKTRPCCPSRAPALLLVPHSLLLPPFVFP